MCSTAAFAVEKASELAFLRRDGAGGGTFMLFGVVSSPDVAAEVDAGVIGRPSIVVRKKELSSGSKRYYRILRGTLHAQRKKVTGVL